MAEHGPTQNIDYIDSYLHLRKRVGQLYDYLLVKNFDMAAELLVEISTDAKMMQNALVIMQERQNG